MSTTEPDTTLAPETTPERPQEARTGQEDENTEQNAPEPQTPPDEPEE